MATYSLKTDDPYEEKAYQAYRILVHLARNQQVIYYGQLAPMLNVHPHVELAIRTLGRVFAMCEANGWPHINSLCINQDDGQPTYLRDADQACQHQLDSFKREWETDPSKLDFSRPSSCGSAA